MQDSVEGGRFVYDEARAEACLGPLIDAAYACDPDAFFARQGQLSEGPGCRGAPFFGEGAITGDGVCQLNAECANGGQCERTSTEPEVISIDGTCTASPAIGEPCDGFCGAGAFCPGGGGEGEGEGGGGEPPPVCTALRSLGEACGDSLQCESNLCNFGGDEGPVCVDSIATEFDFQVCDGR